MTTRAPSYVQIVSGRLWRWVCYRHGSWPAAGRTHQRLGHARDLLRRHELEQHGIRPPFVPWSSWAKVRPARRHGHQLPGQLTLDMDRYGCRSCLGDGCERCRGA